MLEWLASSPDKYQLETGDESKLEVNNTAFADDQAMISLSNGGILEMTRRANVFLSYHGVEFAPQKCQYTFSRPNEAANKEPVVIPTIHCPLQDRHERVTCVSHL